jgi:2-keto-3-deoxy-L-rhamnonate aldolase RhmA
LRLRVRLLKRFLFFSLTPIGKQKFVKIGGCEAVSDFNQAISLGASDIVAPMIESRFALREFSEMFAALSETGEKRFWINLESVDGIANVREIISDAVRAGISGVIVGRGDLSQSLGLARDAVDSREVSKHVYRVLSSAKEVGLRTGVGGGVTIASQENLRGWASGGLLDHFETRKVLIHNVVEDMGKAIQMALRFEIEWLEMLARKSEKQATASKLRLDRLLDGVRRVN